LHLDAKDKGKSKILI